MKDRTQAVVQRFVGTISGILFLIFFFGIYRNIITKQFRLFTAFAGLTLTCVTISLILYILNRVRKGALFGIISFVILLFAFMFFNAAPNIFSIGNILLLICTLGLSIGGFTPSSSINPPSENTSHFKNSNITGDFYESNNRSRFKVLDNDPRYIICLNCGHENFCNYKFCQNCNMEFII